MAGNVYFGDLPELLEENFRVMRERMKYGNAWITYTEDCDENEGGYYCQVYADEEQANQIDDFCITPEQLKEHDLEWWLNKYSKGY